MYGNGSHKHHSDIGKKIGFTVLTGAIAGVVAAGVLSLTIPSVINSSMNKAASRIEKNIESDISDSLPDFSQGNGGFQFPGGNGNGNSGNNNGNDSDSGNSNGSGNDSDNGKSNGSGNSDQNSVDSSSEDSSSVNENAGFLGITCADIDSLTDVDTSGYPEGVYVKTVLSGSPASLAGLKEGDIITAVDGKSVTSYDELKTIISGHSSGDKIKLTIERQDGSDWKTSTHDATLISYAEAQGN